MAMPVFQERTKMRCRAARPPEEGDTLMENRGNVPCFILVELVV